MRSFVDVLTYICMCVLGRGCLCVREGMCACVCMSVCVYSNASVSGYVLLYQLEVSIAPCSQFPKPVFHHKVFYV